MAAVAHESLAEDEILRRADELKKEVSDANTRAKIPAFDRSALDTQEWRPVVLECIELLLWRLLDEHGEVLDEGPDLLRRAVPVRSAVGSRSARADLPSHIALTFFTQLVVL